MTSLSEIFATQANRFKPCASLTASAVRSAVIASFPERLPESIHQTMAALPAIPASLPLPQTKQILGALETLRQQLDSLITIFRKDSTLTFSEPAIFAEQIDVPIEGVFNGQNMIGSDGRERAIPPNYASKSKLVEGDLMNARATSDGRIIFKQIQMIERTRVSGKLFFDESSRQWYAEADGRQYKILTASITFYRGQIGDTAHFIVPKSKDSAWGAMDGISKQSLI